MKKDLTKERFLVFLENSPEFRIFLDTVDDIGTEYMQILLDPKRPERELFTAQGALQAIKRMKMVFEKARQEIKRDMEAKHGKQPN